MITLNVLNEFLIPKPSTVILAIIQERHELLSAISYTLYNAMLGFMLSLIFGTILALFMDKSNFFKKLIKPYLTISQNIPILIVSPIIIIWFGFTTLSKVLIIMLVCVFPITLTFYEGLKLTPRKYLDYYNSLNISVIDSYRYIKIPFALPYLFAGLKIALTYAILASIIAEWSGGSRGIGIYMILKQKSFQTAHLFAAVVIIVVTSLALVSTLSHIEKYIYKRRKQ